MLDAISITRVLRYSHLWIDDLYIVQDDSDDWEHEAANMQATFSNADLIIPTTVASNCHTALFKLRVYRVTHLVATDIWRSKSYRDDAFLAIYLK